MHWEIEIHLEKILISHFGNNKSDSLYDDWMDYLQFDSLLILESDYQKLDSKIKDAIFQWIATGGELRVLRKSKDNSKAIKYSEKYGLGKVRFFNQTLMGALTSLSGNFNANDLKGTFWDLDHQNNDAHLFKIGDDAKLYIGYPHSQNPFAEKNHDPFAANDYKPQLGEEDNSLTMLAIFAFFILVGPLNVLVF